jgi:hypothetical protein
LGNDARRDVCFIIKTISRDLNSIFNLVWQRGKKREINNNRWKFIDLAVPADEPKLNRKTNTNESATTVSM